MAEDTDDKTEDPSGRKLAKAREEGDVPKSGEVPQTLGLIGVCAVVALKGPDLCRQIAVDLLPFLTPHTLLMSLEGDGGMAILRGLLISVLPIILMVMGAAMILGVAGHVLQTGLMFTPSRLAPKLDKLSPAQGFKRIFGVDALVTFFKTVIKLIVTGFIVWMIIKSRATEILNLVSASPALILPYSQEVMIALVIAICMFLIVSAGVDLVWTRYRFHERMKMSKQEVKDEHKSTEGDPHIKARLRQLRLEKSRRRMMQNVAKASVVVTNPTHYAVALQYDSKDAPVPVCLAKGVDDLALRIRAEATKHNVPIVEDPPLARALYASVEVDQILPEAHFAAVARLLGFVMARRKRGF